MIKDRLLQFIEYKRITKSAFERKCGLSNGYINSTKGNIGSKILEQILREYPDLNREWLISGKGEMLSTSQSVGDISNSSVSGVNVSGTDIHINPNAYDTLLKIVETYQASVAKFQEQIDRLILIIENQK